MTQLIVLGMLEMRPMSGYDIQTTLQMLDAERWSGVLVGSIYHALKKLEKDGYVEIASIEMTGHRQKATYRITGQGSEYLKKLIEESLGKVSAVFPTSLYSALTFIDHIPREKAKAALLLQKSLLEKELASLDAGLNQKKEAIGTELPPIVAGSFHNMYRIVRLQKEYVEELLGLL